MQQGYACMADWAGEPWLEHSAAACHMSCEKHSVSAKGCEWHQDSKTCGITMTCTHTKFHESSWGGHCTDNQGALRLPKPAGGENLCPGLFGKESHTNRTVLLRQGI